MRIWDAAHGADDIVVEARERRPALRLDDAERILGEESAEIGVGLQRLPPVEIGLPFMARAKEEAFEIIGCELHVGRSHRNGRRGGNERGRGRLS
jgi:hypothetical protein